MENHRQEATELGFESLPLPEGSRNLDTDATWSKSGYHGWVYGYGLHATCNRQSFPKLAQVETGSVSEGQVLDEKASQIEALAPRDVVGDDNYTKYTRIRTWAKKGIALLTPALKTKGRYVQAYHRFINQPQNADIRIRKGGIKMIKKPP